MDVVVTFHTGWRVGEKTLTAPEQEEIRKTALGALDDAYRGFDVRFAEGGEAARMIRVEDTPFDMQGRRSFGAAGVTYPASTSSSVRFDVLANALLAATSCRDIDSCSISRDKLVAALGRGVGATGAHELGHQAGLLRFALDSQCDDCYDGTKVTSVHFFGTKRWSAEATILMRRSLPWRE